MQFEVRCVIQTRSENGHTPPCRTGDSPASQATPRCAPQARAAQTRTSRHPRATPLATTSRQRATPPRRAIGGRSNASRYSAEAPSSSMGRCTTAANPAPSAASATVSAKPASSERQVERAAPGSSKHGGALSSEPPNESRMNIAFRRQLSSGVSRCSRARLSPRRRSPPPPAHRGSPQGR